MLSRSMAIIGSSSMMRTSVATCAAISRPARSISSSTLATSTSRICAASAGEKPSTAQSRNACRGRGVIDSSLRSTGVAGARRALRLEVDVNRVPQPDKGAIERDARIEGAVERLRILDQHFEGRRHIGVAGGLGAGKRAGEAPQIREMRRDRFGRRHSDVAFVVDEPGNKPHLSQTGPRVATQNRTKFGLTHLTEFGFQKWNQLNALGVFPPRSSENPVS